MADDKLALATGMVAGTLASHGDAVAPFFAASSHYPPWVPRRFRRRDRRRQLLVEFVNIPNTTFGITIEVAE